MSIMYSGRDDGSFLGCQYLLVLLGSFTSNFFKRHMHTVLFVILDEKWCFEKYALS